MSTIKVDTYLTRGGASEIAIDKLKGVSSASSISVVAEGGTNTTNLQQGLAKCWATQIDHGGGAIDGDTFNIASFNDYATGRGRPTMTTAMGNSTYTVIATSGGSNYPYQGWVVDTNTFETSTVNSSANFADGYNNAAIFGDLA